MCFGSSSRGGSRPARVAMVPQRRATTAPTQPLPAARPSQPRAPLPAPSLKNMPRGVVQEACEAVNALGSVPSAIIGGCAVQILGAARGTKDIDLLVPNGTKNTVRRAMRQSDRFRVGEGTQRRQMFSASDHQDYNVDIMQPADLGLPPHHAEGGTISVHGARILKPALLLNLKVYSWSNPTRDDEQQTHDLIDIQFLLRYMHTHGIRTSPQEADLVTEEALSQLIGNRPSDARIWRDIGFPNSRASSQQEGSMPGHRNPQHSSSSGSDRSGQAGPATSSRPQQAAKPTRASKGKAPQVQNPGKRSRMG